MQKKKKKALPVCNIVIGITLFKKKKENKLSITVIKKKKD